MFALFMQGLLIGLAIAAPVGPIGVLCIQRSLHAGFKIGLMTGLGAALADGSYGVIAGFGLMAVSRFLTEYQLWIHLFGGLFLLYLGMKIFLTPAREKSTHDFDQSSWHAFATTYLLTLANPATILSFLAVFAAFGLHQINSHYLHAMILVIGITLGSALWWLLLSGGIAFILHHRLNQRVLKIINWVSGMLVMAFGLYALLSINLTIKS